MNKILELAKQRWNKEADEFNQWDNLSQDEINSLITKERIIQYQSLYKLHSQERNEINIGRQFSEMFDE